MGLISELKEFAAKGNAVDMAVGILVGSAFTKIVNSIVSDLLMPPLGVLIGGVNFPDRGRAEGVVEPTRYAVIHTGAPGFVDTALTAGMGKRTDRMIRSEDVADAVAFVLASSPNCCPTEIVLRPQMAP